MKRHFAAPLLAVALTLGLTSLVQAQTQPNGLTRAQVKMDRDAFLSMARWDEGLGSWVLRSDMPMPEGVMSREEVKAARDKFLSMNRWNNGTSSWVPIQGEPRNMSTLSRSQVKMETTMFLKTHRFDERTQEYKDK